MQTMIISIHASGEAQVALLINKEKPVKYSDFSDVFSSKSLAELPEYTKINDHPINLSKKKQPPYGPIYSQELVELKILKTYIKANLASGFIKLYKSFGNAPILFIQKKNSSLCLYIDYQRLNNLTIKNYYLQSLVDEFLDHLDCAKHFTYLDLKNAYHQVKT